MDNQPDASFIQFVFVCIAGNNLPDYFPTCHLPSSTIGIEDAYSRAYAFPANAVKCIFHLRDAIQLHYQHNELYENGIKNSTRRQRTCLGELTLACAGTTSSWITRTVNGCCRQGGHPLLPWNPYRQSSEGPTIPRPYHFQYRDVNSSCPYLWSSNPPCYSLPSSKSLRGFLTCNASQMRIDSSSVIFSTELTPFSYAATRCCVTPILSANCFCVIPCFNLSSLKPMSVSFRQKIQPGRIATPRTIAAPSANTFAKQDNHSSRTKRWRDVRCHSIQPVPPASACGPCECFSIR